MTRFIDWASQYNKLWVALIGAILTTLAVYFPSEPWVTVLITFATAIGVFTAPNATK